MPQLPGVLLQSLCGALAQRHSVDRTVIIKLAELNLEDNETPFARTLVRGHIHLDPFPFSTDTLKSGLMDSLFSLTSVGLCIPGFLDVDNS